MELLDTLAQSFGNVVGLPVMALIVAFFAKRWFKDLDTRLDKHNKDISSIQGELQEAIGKINTQLTLYDERFKELIKASDEFKATRDETVLVKSKVNASFRQIDHLEKMLEDQEKMTSKMFSKYDAEISTLSTRMIEQSVKLEIMNNTRK